MADFSIFDYSSKGGTFDNLKAYAQKKTLPSRPPPPPSIFQIRMDANKKRIAAFKDLVADLDTALTSLEGSQRNLLKMQNSLRTTRNQLLDAQAAILKSSGPAEYDSRLKGTTTLSAGKQLSSYGISDGSDFSIQLASAASATRISFDSTSTVQDVIDDLDAIANVSARLTDDGVLEIKADDGSAITLSDGANTPLSALGLTAGTNTPELLGNAADGVDRENLAGVIRGVRATVDGYAGTAEYKPDNLLLGGSVKIRVSAGSSAGIPVFGKALNADAIGLTGTAKDAVSDADITQALNEIEAAIAEIDAFEFTLDNTVDLAEAFSDYADGRIEALEKHNDLLKDQLARDLARKTGSGLAASSNSLSGALGLLTGNAGAAL